MLKRRITDLTEVQRTRFDKCWGPYPRKTGKGEAEIAWAQLDPDDALTEEIYNSILAQNRDKGSKYLRAEDKKFIKHFSSWIRARGWIYEKESDGEWSEDKGEKPKCACGKDVAFAHEKLCCDCYSKKFLHDTPTQIKLRERWKQLNIQKLNGSWREACMQYFKTRATNEEKQMLRKVIGG